MITRNNFVTVAALLFIGRGGVVNSLISPPTTPFQSSPAFLAADLQSRTASSACRLKMKKTGVFEDSSVRRRKGDLYAISIADASGINMDETKTPNPLLEVFESSFVESSLLPVLSAALLITGNTVGATMLVLPDVATGPGMSISTGIFLGAFLINLLSGLVIADVAIKQHASSGSEAPSSFKEFAQDSLNSATAGHVVAGLSVFVNALVLAFNTVKAGQVGTAVLSEHGPLALLSSDNLSMLFAVGCLALVSTQSNTALSAITSVLVAGLFVSFAGLILPGMASMANPMDVLMAPATSTDIWASAGELAPIILMSLMYQNIVPTVTKMLDYDRTKTVVSVVLGSLIPLLMYLAWTFCVVGGGIDTATVGMDGLLMTIFSVASIAGSSIGCAMSLSEEFDCYLKQPSSDDDKNDFFSTPSVVASVAISCLLAQVFQGDLTAALSLAGSFGTPLLYGGLPVWMAYQQLQQQQQQPLQGNTAATQDTSLVPGGMASLGFLGLASTGFMGNEVLQFVGLASSS
jgi:tyrosine-specific transport protein